MSTYTAKIDGGDGGEEEFEADSMADAMEQATEWAKGCEWDTSEGTIWCRLTVEDEDGNSEEDTVAIDPEEPKCSDGDHDWQSPHEIVGGIKENPGCFGHGGGVITHQCCMKCGCRRTDDSWAQNPDTGEQGLDSVKYEPGYYSQKLAKLQKD